MIPTIIGFGTKWLQPSAKTHDSPVNWEVTMENSFMIATFFQHLPQPEAAKCNMNITDKLVPSLKMNTSSQYAAASLEKTGSFWDLGIPSLKNALLKNTSGYFKYTLLEVHVWYKASYGWKVYFIVSTTSLENSTISSPSYKDIDCISSLAPFQNSSQFLWCLSCFIFLV